MVDLEDIINTVQDIQYPCIFQGQTMSNISGPLNSFPIGTYICLVEIS